MPLPGGPVPRQRVRVPSAAPESLVPVGPPLAVVVAVLLLAALVVALGRPLRREITAVVGSLPYLLAFLALMLLFAVRTAGRRVTDNAFGGVRASRSAAAYSLR